MQPLGVVSCYEEFTPAKQPAVKNENFKIPLASELDSYLHEILVPSTSVCSEYLFSGTGNVYGKKKKSTLAIAESLVFLHHNLPLLNYKY